MYASHCTGSTSRTSTHTCPTVTSFTSPPQIRVAAHTSACQTQRTRHRHAPIVPSEHISSCHNDRADPSPTWGILDTAKTLLVSRDVLFMSKCVSIDAVEFPLDIQYDVAMYETP